MTAFFALRVRGFDTPNVGFGPQYGIRAGS